MSDDFWDQYDIPFDHGLAINASITELRRGSSGTGRGKDTVTHLQVQESFSEGRLERDTAAFLCRTSGKHPMTVDSPPLTEPVTCSRCRELMKRWKTEGET